MEAVTEDQRYAIVEVSAPGPLLGEASIQGEEGMVTNATLGEKNTYLRDDASGQYRLLAPGGDARFVDSSRDDSSIIFEDRAKLTEKAIRFPERKEAGTNLYQWVNGVVTLVGVLPDETTPEGGAVAGPGGSAIVETEEGEEESILPGGATSGGIGRFDLQNTVSEDGSRIFFTDFDTGVIYMREPLTHRTVQVSAGTKPAYWRAATPSGSFVFYTEGEAANRNLYRFASEGGKTEAITSGEAHVLGTLGISNDGAYVYFVAEGVLPGTSGAIAGEANLYEWHNGELTFITKFSGPGSSDMDNWTDFDTGFSGASQGVKSSRVTPDGTTVLFSSFAQITGYENNGFDELYRYSATQPLSSANPTCISCNLKAHPSKETFLTFHRGPFAPLVRNGFLTNNLSSNGNRIFFETQEALVSQDVNSEMDVYEWESEKEGTCEAGAGNVSGGCLFLISSGQSPTESYFGDASTDGANIFFFTRQSLVSQDTDGNVDIYDARENGGLAYQNRTQEGPCESEACRGALPSSPVFTVPASVILTGMGNLSPQIVTSAPHINVVPRADKLAKALGVCRKKPAKQRAKCRKQADRKYGPKTKKSGKGR